MYNNRDKENNAQKARSNDLFTDKDATTSRERITTGSEIDITRYSDGSSTHHFGGPVGDIEYDENGEEC